MDKKQELMKYCKYYKGEESWSEELSDASNGLFWEAEKLFVERSGTDFEADCVKMYFAAGLAGTNHSLPLFLLASLFTMSDRHSDCDLFESAAFFVEYFLPRYLGSTSK